MTVARRRASTRAHNFASASRPDLEAFIADRLSRWSPTPAPARPTAAALPPTGSEDGSTFFGFADPDGNTWAVQELKVRAQKPLIPVEARGRFGG
jgi:hypothetical protein